MSEAEAAPAPKPARGFPVWLRQALVESVLIVVSLLLALGLSQWNEDRQRAERVTELRQFFAEEIRGNRDMLASASVYPHHVKLRKALFDYAAVEAPTEADKARAFAPFSTGIHPAGFRDAVWRSATMGDVVADMEPREVFMLADIYRVQDALSDINRAAYSQLINFDPNTPDQAELHRWMQTIRFYLGDVVAMEEELLRRYDAALKRLEADPKAVRARS